MRPTHHFFGRLAAHVLLPLGVVVFGAAVVMAGCGSSDSSNGGGGGGGGGGDDGGATHEGGGGGDDGGGPGGDGGSSGPYNPPKPSGTVKFPYTAYRCGYPIRQVSPSNPTAVFDDGKLGGSPQVKNLHLTFAGDPSTSVVVQWSTDDTTTATEVRFGDSAQSLDKTNWGFSFTYGVSGRREHELHLCGLQPGHTYYYDAGGGSSRSKVYSFTTAPSGPSSVKVLFTGDTRTDPSVLTNIATHALPDGPTAMVQSGDAIEVASDQSLWDALFAAAPDLFAQVPGIWVHGNHEGLNELYFAQLALPDNGGARGIEQWFSLDYGPMKIVVLNDTVQTGSDVGLQGTFLDGVLGAMSRTKTPLAVVSHHQPMYTTSSVHPSDTTIRGAWAPIFDSHHVNLDVAGHVHSYESTMPLHGGTASSVGTTTTDAMGTRFINFGGGGAPLYSFGATQSYIQTRESTHGYAMTTIDQNGITWVSHRDDGSTIETITIPK